MATFISRLFLGLRPAFEMPSIAAVATHPQPLVLLLLYATLGAATGLGATAFIRGLQGFEETFQRIGNPYLRDSIGMLLVGLLMYGLLRFTGQYYVDGVGYATIEDVLLGGGGADAGSAARSAVHLETPRHSPEPWIRLLRRNLLAVTVHGGDSRAVHSGRSFT